MKLFSFPGQQMVVEFKMSAGHSRQVKLVGYPIMLRLAVTTVVQGPH